MSEEKEYTGGSVSYYAVDVNDPINENSDPYTAECQDIIEALKLDFQEGNVLKAIWRRAAARLGRSKKGYDDGLYDAEKIVFYGQRLVAAERRSVMEETPKLAPNPPKPDEPVMVQIDDNWATPVPKTWAENVGAEILKVEPEQDPYGPRDAEGWYAWNGDETMRPAGKVDYVCRRDHPRDFATTNADHICWSHDVVDDSGDVVKWRPAQ